MKPSNYAFLRFWYLHELCRLRASARAGFNIAKERKELRQSLAGLRKARAKT